MVLIPTSSLRLIWTSCRRSYIIIWRPPTSCERHNSHSIQPLNSQGRPWYSTGCTYYLHRYISSFNSLAGSEVNMQHCYRLFFTCYLLLFILCLLLGIKWIWPGICFLFLQVFGDFYLASVTFLPDIRCLLLGIWYLLPYIWFFLPGMIHFYIVSVAS